MKSTLSKSEILRGFKSFTQVITTGKALSVPPIRCFYVHSAQNPRRIIAGFSVSRSIRRAVDRNRARRLMRESYRLSKILVEGGQTAPPESLKIVFMYTGQVAALRNKDSFNVIHNSIRSLLSRITSEGAR